MYITIAANIIIYWYFKACCGLHLSGKVGINDIQDTPEIHARNTREVTKYRHIRTN